MSMFFDCFKWPVYNGTLRDWSNLGKEVSWLFPPGLTKTMVILVRKRFIVCLARCGQNGGEYWKCNYCEGIKKRFCVALD